MTLANDDTTTRYGFGTTLNLPIEQAIERTREALKTEGFGVLTTIDVKQTLRDKLDVEFEPYVILGACNPGLAHRGLQADPGLGLLLPCNVIVHERAGASTVTIVNPTTMLAVAGDDPALRAVADEAAGKLRRVVATLAGEATA